MTYERPRGLHLGRDHDVLVLVLRFLLLRRILEIDVFITPAAHFGVFLYKTV